jgi:hypothetical protein
MNFWWVRVSEDGLGMDVVVITTTPTSIRYTLGVRVFELGSSGRVKTDEEKIILKTEAEQTLKDEGYVRQNHKPSNHLPGRRQGSRRHFFLRKWK